MTSIPRSPVIPCRAPAPGARPARASLAGLAILGVLALPGCGDTGNAAADATGNTVSGTTIDPSAEFLPDDPAGGDAGAAIRAKASNDRATLPDTNTPYPPTRVPIDLASYFDTRQPPLVGQSSPDGGIYPCDVDFNDPQAKETAMRVAWMDRIYLPWWQQCTMGRIDIRPTVYEHVHLNFLNLDLTDCMFDSPDGFPYRRVNGVCQPIDPATEPRTDISTHTGEEVVLIRGYTTDTSQYQRARFDLVRLRVSGQQPVKVCYQPVTQDHSKCFVKALAPGYYDFSGLVTEVVKVEIKGATPTTFSLDDIRVSFGAALP